MSSILISLANLEINLVASSLEVPLSMSFAKSLAADILTSSISCFSSKSSKRPFSVLPS